MQVHPHVHFHYQNETVEMQTEIQWTRWSVREESARTEVAGMMDRFSACELYIVLLLELCQYFCIIKRLSLKRKKKAILNILRQKETRQPKILSDWWHHNTEKIIGSIDFKTLWIYIPNRMFSGHKCLKEMKIWVPYWYGYFETIIGIL